MTADPQRLKLDTKIESEVHRFVQSISENVFDRLNIYVRRNEIPIEPDVLAVLLKTMQVSITEFEMNGIDKFHAAIKTHLDDYVGDESPAIPVVSTPKPPSPPSKKTPKTVSFSV